MTANSSSPPKVFKIEDAPTKGAHLIEANAGTGKTFSLVLLYLKLIFNGYNPNKIVVVTFSRAATQEISTRIKAGIEILLFRIIRYQITGDKNATKDDPISQYFYNIFLSFPDHEQHKIKERLVSALFQFNEGQIHTIHAFMQQVLNDFAFEMGRQGYTLEEDEESLIQIAFHKVLEKYFVKKESILDDQVENDFFVDYLLSLYDDLSPKPKPHNIEGFYDKSFSLFNNLKDFFSRPSLQPFPTPKHPTKYWNDRLIKLINDFVLSTTDFQFFLKDNINYFLDELWVNSVPLYSGLHKSYQTKVRTGFLELLKTLNASKGNDNWGEYATLLNSDFDFNKYSKNSFQSKLKKNSVNFEEALNHYPLLTKYFEHLDSFVGTKDKLQKKINEVVVAFLTDLIEEVKQKLKVKKELNHVFSFNDTIFFLSQELRSKNSKLINKINQRYQAFLIDEFQDTDPEQYFIFSTLYQKQPRKKVVYFIGDPKQSIYGFRDANIHTYYRVKEEVDSVMFLTDNYRTDGALLKQVNQIFQDESGKQVANPFRYPLIQFSLFSESSSDSKPNISDSPALIINFAEKKINKDLLHKLLVDRMLQQLKSFPESLQDTAVLTRNNSSVQKIKSILDEYNIPAIMVSDEDIFASEEASQLKLVLRGILNWKNYRFFTSAFTAHQLGVDIIQQTSTEKRSVFFQKHTLHFRELLQIWQKRGILALFSKLNSLYRIYDRLLAPKTDSANSVGSAGSTRSYTNWIQLEKILTDWEMGRFFSPEGLYQQLVTQVDRTPILNEGGRNAVKIATIHRSKGLEYPFVHLIDFFKDYREEKSELVVFHGLDESNAENSALKTTDIDDQPYELLIPHQLKIDPAYQHFYQRYLVGQHAEALRLFYVGITRAKQHIQLYLNSFNTKDLEEEVLHKVNPFVYLQKESSLSSLKKQGAFVNLTNKEAIIDKNLAPLGQTHTTKNNYQITQLTTRPSIVDYTESFTSISGKLALKVYGKSKKNSTESQIADTTAQLYQLKLGETLSALEELVDPDPLQTFPGGVETGLMFHELLENWDFFYDSKTVDNLLSTTQKNHPNLIKQDNKEVFHTLLKTLCETTLFDRFSLAQLTSKLSSGSVSQHIKEMDFYFKLGEISNSRTQESSTTLEQRVRKFMQNHSEIFSKPSVEEPSSGGGLFHTGTSSKHNTNLHYKKGMVRGFIDLVVFHEGRYYIIDWKSNQLPSYQADQLLQTMKDDLYHLQALIYLVAMDKWLKFRMPNYCYEENFGGIAYIFLRGVKQPRQGVHYFHPDKKLFEEFSSILNLS